MRASQEFIKDHLSDLFVKVRNGLYALRLNQPHEEVLANRLYAPSYISFEYALSKYGIIPESVYTITSATTRLTREFTVGHHAFSYAHIKKEVYRGYESKKIGKTTVLIAYPEKALIDYLYFVDLRLKSLNDRLNVKTIRKKEAILYASYFKRPSLQKFVRKIL